MKKLATLSILIIFTLAGSSQNLSLSYEGQSIPNGGVISVVGDISLPELIAEIDVTNSSTSSIEVKVTKIENYLIQGSSCYYCWGACYPPNVYTSPLSITIGAGQTNTTDFSGHYGAAGNFGVSSVSFMFFDMNHPADNVTVEILFNAGTVGLSEKNPSSTPILSCNPNPANEYSIMTYSVSQEIANPELKIVSLTGTIVASQLLESNSGSIQISTATLPNGIYFVSLVKDNKTLLSKKIIVNH